jgi:hypothetical protein
MKIGTTLCAAIILGLSLPQLANARVLYQLHWTGGVYSGFGGKVKRSGYSEKDIIKQAAQDNGLVDTKGLAFVYVADAGTAEVVVAATGETIARVFDFQAVNFSSSDDSQTVRQAFIFDDSLGRVTGSVFVTQKTRHDVGGNTIGFSYRGTFQFSIPETDKIYYGNFSTGKRLP